MSAMMALFERGVILVYPLLWFGRISKTITEGQSS
jgi:hypothetical protein